MYWGGISGCGIQTPAPTEGLPTAVETEAEILATIPADASPQPTVVPRMMMPGEPSERSDGIVGDQDSSVTAIEKRAPSGDRFTFNRFERPFNANTMNVYVSQIDIQNATLLMEDTWLYFEITLKDLSRGGAWKYGMELDLNVDGKGDLLVLTLLPASTVWSTSSVEVWEDANEDVGGVLPAFTDEAAFTGDGFELRLFGGETSADPDLAWARISPANPNAVQFALKRDLLAGNPHFLAGGWAGGEDLNPALFDINDNYTHEQAGTSVVELPIYYPIKEVSELDNTCRMAIGFQPHGNEPGLCPLPPKPEGSEGAPPPSQAACPPQFIYCYNTGNQTICTCVQP